MGERRKFKMADEVGILLCMHFPEVEPEGKEDPFRELSCAKCEERRQGVCPGKGLYGWGVVKCMERKAGALGAR